MSPTDEAPPPPPGGSLASQPAALSVPGPERTKRRRVKTGCYTCRERRVKCDEARPTCEKCRRGKRTCDYPGSAPSTSATPPPVAGPSRAISTAEDIPRTLSQANYRFVPATSASNGPQFSDPSRLAGKPQVSGRWQSLSKETKTYMFCYHEEVTCLHYCIRLDPAQFFDDVLHMTMTEPSEALMHAVAAYGSYFYAFMHKQTDINEFLSHYNTSIALLSQSLAQGQRTIGTIITILQLATLEQSFGDSLSTTSHQKACKEILLEIYTPQTIVQDSMGRMILFWYMNFDIAAGLMGRESVGLGREWYAALAEHTQAAARNDPGSLNHRFEAFSAAEMLFAADIAFLLERKDTLDDTQFETEAQALLNSIVDFKHLMQLIYGQPSCFVKSFPQAPSPSEDDITDYQDPNFLYKGELFTLNFLMLEIWTLEMNFKRKLCDMFPAKRATMSQQIYDLALNICKMFEAIEYCEESPNGSLKISSTSMAAASLVLANDEKHINWFCRKFALLENFGVISSISWPQQVSHLWARDVTQGWLPDQEIPEIVAALRDLVDGRSKMLSEAANANNHDRHDSKTPAIKTEWDDLDDFQEGSSSSVRSSVDWRAPGAHSVGVLQHSGQPYQPAVSAASSSRWPPQTDVFLPSQMPPAGSKTEFQPFPY